MRHQNGRNSFFAFGVVFGLSLAASMPVASVGAARSAVLSIDPVPAMTVGQTPVGVVIAHLTAGGPVVGARLDLFIDDSMMGTEVTDTDGTAQIQFRRELATGDHTVEVKFNGSLDIGPASASAGLHVWPASQAQLRIDPLPALQVAKDPAGVVMVHLGAGGLPLAGARLALLIDGSQAAGAVTNASGAAELPFRRELAAGDHLVEVRFDGSQGAGPTSASALMHVQEADQTQLQIDQLPVLQLGQDMSASVIAHLTVGGTAVPGARLGLLVDSVPAGSEVTDDTGTAQIHFRRDLAAGDHKIEVKFDGSRAAATVSASAALTVQPLGASVLTVEPLADLQVGEDPALLVVAHLISDGAPVGGARLALLIDDAPAASGVTDSGGTVELRVRRELAAGGHKVQVQFDGSRSVAPVTTTVKLAVQPQATGVVVVEPPDALQVGQDSGAVIIAHLTTGADTPVSGARLTILVDGAPVGTGFTDAGGTAELHFRRELGAGQHDVEVRFDGTRSVGPASGTQQLVVRPIAGRGLSLDPLPVLQVGQDPGATIVAHLASDDGDAVPGARLALVIDGVPLGTGLTDTSGTAELHFRHELSPGDHRLEIRFDGSRSAAPAGITNTLTVLPMAVRRLTLDPLTPLRVGEDPATTVIAHLVDEAGEPVGGERLSLVVDGLPAGTAATDADGTAELRFRREMLAGEHSVEVRFDGSRAATPVSVSDTLVVAPAAASQLTIEPVPTLTVGQSSLATVVAHLSAETGQPLGGARLELLVDGMQERLGLTDASGSAQLKFRPDLLPGEHVAEVRFAGSRGVTPASASTGLSVQPAEVEVQVVPALAGAQIAVDGRIFTSGADGIARLEMARPGAYHLEVLPWDSPVAGMRLEFDRWGDEVFTPTRDVVVPQTAHLEVGFDTSFLVGLTFADPQGNPVDLGRITSATLISSAGTSQAFQPSEQHWLQGARIVRRAGGVAETKLQYAVDNVVLGGSNAVNSREQRFYLSPNLQAPVQLMLHSMRIGARSMLFDLPTGQGVWLRCPDGHTEWHAFGSNGEVELSSLPRGDYIAQVEAPGLTFPQPISLSRDQVVLLKVVSYTDLAGVALLLGVLAFALPAVVRLRRPKRETGAGPNGGGE